MTLKEALLQSLLKKPEPGKYTDVPNLVMKVSPKGTMSWQTRLRLSTGEKTYSHGTYPGISLKQARIEHMKIMAQKLEGEDPTLQKKAAKIKLLQSQTGKFEQLATEWFDIQSKDWSKTYASRLLSRLQRFVFPYIGHIPVAHLHALEIKSVLTRIVQQRKIETAHRVLTAISQILNFAIGSGYISHNIAPALRKQLPKHRAKHMAALTRPDSLAEFLRKIDTYNGTFVTICALRLTPMLFVRSNELRGATWSEIDLENAMWTIPAMRMKREKDGKENGDPHHVPLSHQAVSIFRELQKLTGNHPYVFPNQQNPRKRMSGATINSAIKRLGYNTKTEVTGHGFRATALTLLQEKLGYEKRTVEAQLSHVVPGALGNTYDRALFLETREKMMQDWSDYLDKIKTSH